MMKKLVAILGLALSSQVFAGSATFEGQRIDNASGADQNNYNLTVRESIAKGVTGDIQFSNTYTRDTGAASSTRIEAGVTPTLPLGPVTGYARVAVGQKASTGSDFTYYSVEPGVSAPLGAGFTAKLGYRFRNAFDTGNNDTTRTIRAGLSYDLTKTDSVGVRFDRVQGDADQKVWAVGYTRSF